jgi:hypothetical protein
MPAAGIMATAALVAIGYFYVAKPIVHVAKKTAHGVVHVVTLGKK